MTSNTDEQSIKMILLGNTGVGKSSLVMRLVDQQFTSTSIQTVGIDFRQHLINLGGNMCKLQVWDTAGDERFRTITRSYLNGVHCIIVVCDLTDEDSIASVPAWLDEARTCALAPSQWSGLPPVLTVAANKADAVPDPAAAVAKLKLSLGGVPVFPVSAKEGGPGVAQCFAKSAALCAVRDAGSVGATPPTLTSTLSFARPKPVSKKPSSSKTTKAPALGSAAASRRVTPPGASLALALAGATGGGCFGSDGVLPQPDMGDVVAGCVRPLISGWEMMRQMAKSCVATASTSDDKPKTVVEAPPADHVVGVKEPEVMHRPVSASM